MDIFVIVLLIIVLMFFLMMLIIGPIIIHGRAQRYIEWAVYKVKSDQLKKR